MYAHASVGCLHVRPVVNLKTEDGVRRFEAIANDVADLVLEFGGALSGEHGDGLVRGPFIGEDVRPGALRRVPDGRSGRSIRDGLFNPGKIVDTPPLTANLRFGAAYRTPDPHHVLRLQRLRRLRPRRRDVQRARRVPQDARRHDVPVIHGHARGSSIRRAAAPTRCGWRWRAGSASRASATHGVYEVLDLCLECRACKAECPVGVDVARFKSEFLADYWQRHGTPLRRARDRTRAHARQMGQPLAPDVERRREQRRRPLAERTSSLGIDRRRTLPRVDATTRFARSVFIARARPASPPPLLPLQPVPSCSFNDTFTNYMHPEIGMAAVDGARRRGLDRARSRRTSAAAGR